MATEARTVRVTIRRSREGSLNTEQVSLAGSLLAVLTSMRGPLSLLRTFADQCGGVGRAQRCGAAGRPPSSRTPPLLSGQQFA